MKLKIKYIGNPILREQALEVKEITEGIRELVAKMIILMDELRGVGLAATQVGFLYRIFVIRARTWLMRDSWNAWLPLVVFN